MADIYLFISLFVYLFIYPFVYLVIYLINLFIHSFIAFFSCPPLTKTGVLDHEGKNRRVRTGSPAHDQLPGRPTRPLSPAAQLRAIAPPWPRRDSDGVGTGQRRPLLPSGALRPPPGRGLRCHPHGRTRSRRRPPTPLVLPADQEEAAARRRRQRSRKPRIRRWQQIQQY